MPNTKSLDNLIPGNPGRQHSRRLTNAQRELCRAQWALAIKHVGKIARGEEDGCSPAESINAFNALGKFGIGEVVTVALTPENTDIAQTAEQIVADMFGVDRLHEFTERLIGDLAEIANPG